MRQKIIVWWYDSEYNNVLFQTPAIVDDGISYWVYSYLPN
jgi:hypothetical protein